MLASSRSPICRPVRTMFASRSKASACPRNAAFPSMQRQTVRADAILEVGSSNQAGRSPGLGRIPPDRRRQEQRTTLQNNLVNDLPLLVNGTVRTPFDLASLTPDAKNLGGDEGFAIGGGQAAAYGTTLDGVSTNTVASLAEKLDCH